MRHLLRVPTSARINETLIRRFNGQRLSCSFYTTFASSNLALEPTSTTTNDKRSINFSNNQTSSINLDNLFMKDKIDTKVLPLFHQLLMHLKENNFNKVISVLNSKGSGLNIYQLSDIYHLFYQFEKYRHMLTIFAIFKQDIAQNIELLELTLTAAYKDKNYQLFDDLFKIYIESSSKHLNADIFNLALKVYLRTDPGLAKQFLYQMFQSDYPINEMTLYEYLKVADKEAIFQSIQFVVDMLNRYPLTPINDAAYAELYSSYHKHGTNYDIGLLLEFLSKRQVLEIESIKVAQFLNELDYEGLPMEEIWRRLHYFKLQQSLSLENLQKVYQHLYKCTYKKMTLEDVFEYVRLMKDDGIPFSDSSIQQKVIYHKYNEQELYEYLKKIKSEGAQLDQYIIKAIWARLSTNNRSFSDQITENLLQLSKDHEGKTPWIDTLPNILILRSKKQSDDRFLTSDRYGYDKVWKREQIRNYVFQGQDYKILEMLMDMIRRGTKPDVDILGYMLKSLSQLQSPNIHRVYSLIHDIYRSPPPEIEIIYFGDKIYQLKQKLRKTKQHAGSKAKSELLVNNFALKYQGKLSCENYIQLSSYIIDLKCYNTALNYIGIAKSLIPQNGKRLMTSIYSMILKTLSRSRKPEEFIAILKMMSEGNTLNLSPHMFSRISDYKKSLVQNIADPKQKTVFIKHSVKYINKLKNVSKFHKQKVISQVDNIHQLLDEWIEEQSNREH